MADLEKQRIVAKEIEFVWAGKDKHRHKVLGELVAIDEKAARTELHRRRIIITRLKKKPPPLFSKRVTKITSADISIFARQFATMLNAGVPVVQGLDIVGHGHENASMRDLLLTIKTDVENGDSLTQALRKHPAQFDDLFCNLIAAGEHAGVLETLLDKIATYKEKSESMKKKVKKAMTYPVSVMAIALIVTTILLVFVESVAVNW